MRQKLGGRSIYTLSIGPQENPVLYTGGFHGQEWLTPLLLLRFFERTATAVWEGDDFSAIPIQDALHGRGMMIVPCVNPDGIQIALRGAQGAGPYEALATQISGGDFSRWNANARGVDINHNLTPVGKHCTKWSGNLELPDPRPGNMAALLRKASRKRRRWCGCAEAIPFAMRWPFTARGKKSFGSMANIRRSAAG